MAKILVVFYSRTGNTARVADAVAEGAERVRFSEVEVRRLDDLAPPDVIGSVPDWQEARDRLSARYRTLGRLETLEGYDAIILGAPARYGVMAAEVKEFLGRLETLAKGGELSGRVGSAFTSLIGAAGGPEGTLWSMMMPMGGLGMVLVAPSGEGGAPAGDEDQVALEHGRRLGERVARVASWVAHARSHEHGHAGGHHHHHSQPETAHTHSHSH